MEDRKTPFLKREVTVRNDSLGSGSFGAPRTHNGAHVSHHGVHVSNHDVHVSHRGVHVSHRSVHVSHRGVDIEAAPGSDVFAPVDGLITFGQCYRDTDYFELVGIVGHCFTHRMLYVKPTIDRKLHGSFVKAFTKIGVVQDIRKRYGDKIVTHIHWEIKLNKHFKHDQIYLLDKGLQPTSDVWIDPERWLSYEL